MSDQEDFLAKATDPNQYDNPELHWEQEGFGDSPVRVFMWDKIRPILGDLEGESVLDIGTGTAWLPFRMQQELGADHLTAIEPSDTQRQLARRFNPDQPVLPVGLMDFETDETFDIVTAIMMFEHIHDLDEAFEKLQDLTQQGSRLVIVMADKANFLRPRADYDIQTQEVDSDTVAIRALRAYGVLHDIVRPVGKLVDVAEKHGFELWYHQPLVPDEALRQQIPRYQDYPDQPICHLLVLDRMTD